MSDSSPTPPAEDANTRLTQLSASIGAAKAPAEARELLDTTTAFLQFAFSSRPFS